MKEPILVTGATGFVGSYLVRRLVDNGRRVRALVRSPEKLAPQLRNRVEVAVCDLTIDSAHRRILEAVSGCSSVLHLAAVAKAWSPAPEEFTKVNVEAVRSLLEAATINDIDTFVHVSTILTLPPYRPAQLNGPSTALSDYELSKMAGERLVEEYSRSGRHTVIVHPTRIYGPGPLTDANAVSQLVAMYLKGQFRFTLKDGDIISNYVHADDVAAGIILAAERGQHGAHYVLGGENASFSDLLGTIDSICGRPRHVFRIPPPVALVGARLAEAWGRLGGTAPLTPAWIRVFLEDRRVDLEETRQQLGYAPRSLHNGLEQTIAWIGEQ